MNYDFIEIGTAYFGTLIETASDTTRGISVEPIKEYLDRLPNKPGVIKVNAAITDKKSSDTISIYYVPQQTIQEHHLGDWLAGCNSVNKPHDFHLAYTENVVYYHLHPDEKIQGRNLVEEGLVSCSEVPVLTFEELGKTYDIGDVEILKVDTEGHDPYILRSVFNYYKEKALPKNIQFECNRHSDKALVGEIIKELMDRGYSVTSTHNDCIANR
jgi:hypothetical protein